MRIVGLVLAMILGFGFAAAAGAAVVHAALIVDHQAGASVPSIAGWAAMLAGFGLLGAASRSDRGAATLYA